MPSTQPDGQRPQGLRRLRILAADLDEHVLTYLMALVVDPDRRIGRTHDADERDARVAELRAEVAELDAADDRLVDAVADGTLDRAKVRAKRAELPSSAGASSAGWPS